MKNNKNNGISENSQRKKNRNREKIKEKKRQNPVVRIAREAKPISQKIQQNKKKKIKDVEGKDSK